MEDEAILYLALFVIIVALVVAFIIYIVIPIIGILIIIGVGIMAAVAGWGLISGIFVGIKNFFSILNEAHRNLP
jgi:hypothetical protein